jgi:excisionase family DNA binding protein
MTARQATAEQNALLTPAEVALAFRVDPKTVTRWARTGKLRSIRTLGGHRRYLESDVSAILSQFTAASEARLWLAADNGSSHGR